LGKKNLYTATVDEEAEKRARIHYETFETEFALDES
jgi:hypothetical protein